MGMTASPKHGQDKGGVRQPGTGEHRGSVRVGPGCREVHSRHPHGLGGGGDPPGDEEAVGHLAQAVRPLRPYAHRDEAHDLRAASVQEIPVGGAGGHTGQVALRREERFVLPGAEPHRHGHQGRPCDGDGRDPRAHGPAQLHQSPEERPRGSKHPAPSSARRSSSVWSR